VNVSGDFTPSKDLLTLYVLAIQMLQEAGGVVEVLGEPIYMSVELFTLNLLFTCEQYHYSPVNNNFSQFCEQCY
jgi:hypothetical protein